MGTLGNGIYSVTLAEWSGRTVWKSTDTKFGGVQFSREIDETTKATLDAFIPANVSNRLEPWINTMTIYRDSQLVWHGYVTKISTTGRLAKVEAADGSVMFDRRRIASNRTWRQHDATQVMRTHVEDGLGYADGVQIVENIMAEESRIWVTESRVAAESMVRDVVDDMVDQGLVWAVSSGRLLIGPVGARRTTPQLTDSAWQGEITIVKDGTEMVTDALVTGQGVWGSYTAGETPYGWLQAIESASGAVREEDCTQTAKRIVTDSRIAPRRVEVSSGARLLSTAPIEFQELIPGTRIPVSSSQAGVTVGSTMQLRKVDVTVDDSGEDVSVTLAEERAADAPEAQPDPSELDWRSPYEKEVASKNTQAGSGSAAGTTANEVGLPPV